ncbi:hypothetical protein EXT66_17565 [Pectobacterium carotovorum subsp. carotovorum]|nr:hypothetical protein [Pectobacterium carotovorum]MCL6335691.1 hypothetical protein [Pectobacterium carotovorum subsp. carotovorum]MCL6348603.1 hypothetical protein [Pectobacterium carotovorum subsp. carotovorum]MCL6403065.1 hypothetical protein [Pectobacterium carotovorum subsp. carotovorum]
MTNNLTTFMTSQFTQWFNQYSGGETVERVIVVPCSPSDRVIYDAMVSEGVSFFKSCEWGNKTHKDDYYIYQLKVENKEFFLYWSKGFESDSVIDEDIGLIDDQCHFLSNLVFYTEFNIQPNRLLSSLETNGYVFQDELIETVPKLLTLSLGAEYGNEKFEIKIIRVLLYIELLDRKQEKIYDKIIGLALSLPEENHDWLYFELIRAIRSKKQDSMFLCLYKMLEFFFPLKNVFNLSTRISYSGSPLQLLEYCRNELNWNVNHNYGLRGAKDYSSHAFCSHLDFDLSTVDTMTDNESRKNKIDQLKSDGLEKLSTLRHTLTHQNFRGFEVEENEISKYITAIIVFLTESFSEYSQRITN